MIRGLDMAEPCPSAAKARCLAVTGHAFVGRYYTSPQNAWKLLTRREARMLSQAGLSIVAIFEDGATELSAGLGVAHAQTALSCAAEAGQPPGSAIYFAVDYNATPDQIGQDVIPYFRAIQPLMTAEHTPSASTVRDWCARRCSARASSRTPGFRCRWTSRDPLLSTVGPFGNFRPPPRAVCPWISTWPESPNSAASPYRAVENAQRKYIVAE